MQEITFENAPQVIEKTTAHLKQVANNLETFLDYATICSCLRDLSEAALVTSGHEGYESYDNTTKTNLEVLVEILDASSKLFVSCDKYYR